MSYVYKPRVDASPMRLNHLMKEAVRHKVHYALRTGKLQKEACEYVDCIEMQSEAHHPDYNYPLDVIWLCKQHHFELHRNVGYTMVNSNFRRAD